MQRRQMRSEHAQYSSAVHLKYNERNTRIFVVAFNKFFAQLKLVESIKFWFSIFSLSTNALT